MKMNARKFNFKFFGLFLEKGAVHGLPYVGKRQLTYLERIIWLILTFVALYFSIHLALESLDKFKTKSTVISIEKDFHYWNTTLPSITACPMQRLSHEKFDAYCYDKNITGTDKVELFNFLESLANSSYFNFNDILDYPSIEKHNIKPKDYIYLIYNLTENLILTPDNKSRIVSKSDAFAIRSQQILTEWGICYSTNNYLIEGLSTSNLLFGKPAEPHPEVLGKILIDILAMNIFDGEGWLNFLGFFTPLEIFVHGANEVMRVEERRGASEVTLECKMKLYDIVASDSFGESTTLKQRQCRFPHESNLTHFPIYTRNLCHQQCRIDLAYKLCKCIPHFYSNLNGLKPVCHYKVLKDCLFKYARVFENLNEVKSIGFDTLGCYCLPMCRSSEIVDKVWQIMAQSNDLLGSNGAILVMKQYPIQRYRRQIIFTLTDLLVSIGGTVGFFLGSSVLSAVEIFYYFSIRLIWHCIGYQE